jgi:hypothetical protein
MFGTLVIQLLSDYSGGELAISHGGKEEVFDFSGMKGCVNYHYAAFYADCQHEIKTVTEGYRLCLIYNLLYTGTGSTPVPADNLALINRIVVAMMQWNEEATNCRGPEIMAYLLEHMYCEASLSFKCLKNIDRAVGDVLLNAHQQVDFDLYLAHVSISQTWGAMCHHSGYGRCYYDSDPEYEVDELYDEDVSATTFVTPNDQKVPLTNLTLSKRAIVPKGAFKDVDPDQEECNEATGNEGATVERWYRWTALLLWPTKRRVLLMGLDNMTAKLKADVNSAASLSKDKQKQCLELARDLVLQSRCTSKLSSKSAADLLCCLRTLGQVDLLHQFLKNDISGYIGDHGFCDQIISLSETVGWEAVRPTIIAMVQSTNNVDACCSLINKVFALHTPNTSTSEPKLLCKELATAFIKGFPNIKFESYSYSSRSLSPNSVAMMLKCLLGLEESELISQFLTSIASISGPHHSSFIGSPQCIDQLLDIGQSLGWERLRPGLGAMIKSAGDRNACCGFIDKLFTLSSVNTTTAGCKLLCKELVTVFINSPPSVGDRPYSSRLLTPNSAVMILKCLQGLEEVQLTSQFTVSIASTDCHQFICSQSFIDQLVETGRAIGWESLGPGLVAMFQNLTVSSENISVCVDFLTKLVPTADPSTMTDEQKSWYQTLIKVVTRSVCREQDIAFPTAQPPRRKSMSTLTYTYLEQPEPSSRSFEFVLSLFKLIFTLECGKEALVPLVSAFLRQPIRYPIVTVIAAALEEVYLLVGEEKKECLHPLITSCITALENPSLKSITPDPKGWSQKVSVRCTCQDCQVLQEFLKSSTRVQVLFQMILKRRSHVEKQLAQLKCVSYSTDRSRSPHTLVVKKIQQSHEQKQVQQQIMVRVASRLRVLHTFQQKLSASGEQEPVPKRQKRDEGGPGSRSDPALSSGVPTVTVIDLTHEK